MSSHKRFNEILKDALIVLLLLSAVFLGWKSRLFGNSSARTGDVFTLLGGLTSTGEAEAGDAELTEASKPLCIVLTNAAGHYGVKYDMDEINALYKKTVLIFSEALGTAAEAQKVSEDAWRAALKCEGVYYEYMTPVRLSVLDGWYGSEISGSWADFYVRRLCVIAGDGQNTLYFMDDDTGDFYASAADTSDRITGVTETTAVNNTFFACELDGKLQSPTDYTVLQVDVAEYPIVDAGNPLADGETLKSVLLNLGNSEQNSYTEGDAKVFPDEDFNIRVYSDGTLVYTRTGKFEKTAADMDESGAVELARQQVAGTIGSYCGSDTAVYFNSVEENDGVYNVTFSYVVAGGIVHLPADRYAAVVTVSNGIITNMELYFRTYTLTGETVQLLPEVQAAAASDGSFSLWYADDGSRRVEPLWITDGN